MQIFFDRNRLKAHRNRAAYGILNYDFLIKHSTEDIITRIESLDFLPKKVLEIGSRHGILSEYLSKYDHLIVSDIAENMLALNPAKNKIILDDEEVAEHFDQKFDMVVSVLNIHWINNVQKFLSDIFGILSDNGVFIASFFGMGSLNNLKQLLFDIEAELCCGHSVHISPFMRMEDTYKLLQLAGFSFVVVDSETVEIEYGNALALMRDLRWMGEGNNSIHASPLLPKAVVQRLHQLSTLITEKFEIITFTVSKKNLRCV